MNFIADSEIPPIESNANPIALPSVRCEVVRVFLVFQVGTMVG
jgi:hypothetical protein